MIGFNTNFSTELPFLTRWVNKIPTIKTNVPSNLSFRGEVANLIAGKPKTPSCKENPTSILMISKVLKPTSISRDLIRGNFPVFPLKTSKGLMHLTTTLKRGLEGQKWLGTPLIPFFTPVEDPRGSTTMIFPQYYTQDFYQRDFSRTRFGSRDNHRSKHT